MNISPRILLLATCLVFGAVPASVHAETTTHQQFVEQLQQLRQKKITVSQALADKNNALSQRAAIAYLRQNWNESAGDILEKFLPQAQGQVAVETMGALTEYRRVSALSAIREKLGKDSDYGVKTEALICLGVMGNSGDVATLIEYAKDAQYRASAEQALFGIAGAGVAESFSKVIGDPKADPGVRKQLMSIATRRPLRQVVPALIKNLSDADESIRNESLKSISRLAVSRDVDALKKARAQISDKAFGERVDAAIQKLEQ